MGAAVSKLRPIPLLLFTFLAASVSAQSLPRFHPSGTGQGYAFISGTVSTAGGGPLASILVQLQTPMGDVLRTTTTDTSGAFAFGGLSRGSYAVVVSLRGYQTGRWPVQIGFANVTGIAITLIPSHQNSGPPVPKGSGTVSVRHLLIPKEARKEYRKGLKSAAHGKINEAIRHWKRSIKIYPQYAESYMQLSRAYANRGQFHLAEDDAKRAVTLDGKSARSYNYLGYVYVQEKHYPQAKTAFQNSVQLDGSDWYSQFWLGEVLLHEKDPEGAHPHLLSATKLNPKMPEAYLLLYNDLLQLNHGRQALAELDIFLKRFPHNPMVPTVRKKRASLMRTLASQSR